MRHKLTLLLLALFTTVGAWADVLNLTPANGTYVTSASNYVNSITFSTIPAITVTASANNMDKRQTGSYLLWHSGTSNSSTYTISVEGDYVITAYSVTGEANTSAQTLTAGANSHEFAVGTSSTFTVTGVSSSSVSFVLTGANASGLKITSISVTVVQPTEEQAAAYNTVQNWIPIIQSAKGLVTDASNYVSNAKESSEGSYEALLDGNYSTYFHSAYNNAPAADHYLQATLSEPVEAFYFYFKKRSQNNANRPTSITISGSNDGSTFTNITTISSGLPTDASVLDYTSSKISLGASYQYLRFTVTATNTGAAANGHVFFTFSEFYILPSDTEVDDVMALRAALAGTSAVNYTAQNISDITAANTALTSTMVNVTYNLFDIDGTTLLDTKTVEQEKNSSVSIPSSFITKTWLYDYTATGSIGTTDCVITVNRVYKTGVVTSLTDLSNNKAYRLVTERGTFTTDNGELTNTVKSGSNYTVYNFAIVQHESAYYLWSVQDGKFVAGSDKALTETPTSITINTLEEPLFKIQCGSNYLNCNANNGGFFSSWSTTDGGNRVAIIEAADFDPTPVIEALTNFAPSVVANIKPFFDAAGSGLFQLKASVAEANNATYTAALTSCNAATYDALLAIVSNVDNFNLPEAGKFYYIKNVSNGKYLRATGMTRGNILADVTSPDISSVVKVVERDGHIYMGTQGGEFSWVYGSGYSGMMEVTGKYAHFSVTTPGQGAFAHALGNGESGYEAYLPSAYYAVNGENVVVGSTANAAAAQWTFEEVSTLTIDLNGPIDGYYYATFCVPFNVTFDGTTTTAYTLSLNAGETGLTLSDGITEIAAGTPVLLKGTLASTTATISTAVSSAISTETALTGTYFAKSVNGATDYFLGSADNKVGFYHWDGPTLAANRAYFEASKLSAPVKGLVLDYDDDATGIEIVDGQSSMVNEIYNLAGQRMNKMQKGINIVNGKKILK